MTFVPMYVPIHYGGGGGGDPKGTAIGLLLVVGIGVIGGNYITKPKFQMKICKNMYHKEMLQVNIRYKGSYPRIHSLKHYNSECLRKKGYTVQEVEQPFRQVYLSDFSWDSFATIEKLDRSSNILKEKIVPDCKMCNVYTEIIYSYDNFFGKEVQAKNTLYWHKNYVEELK
jgi:hypothetical protein